MPETLPEFDVLVVGAGPAGLAAASAAAESGCRVGVVDDSPWMGGQIWRGEQHKFSSSRARACFQRFERSGAVLLSGAAAIAVTRNNRLLVESSAITREIHWRKLILATGARELFLPFPGWTLPGVLGPGGLQALVKNGWPISGKRVVVAGSGPLLLAVADGLRKHGARIPLLAEQAPWPRVRNFGMSLLSRPAKLLQGAQIKWRLGGVPYRFGTWPTQIAPTEDGYAVTLTNGAKTSEEMCDYLACGFGLVPNVELALALKCELEGGFVRVDEFQKTNVPGVFCAGEPTGIGGVDCALAEGRIAGYAAAEKFDCARKHFRERASWHRFRSGLDRAFALRAELKKLAKDDTLVCRCEDVPLGRLKAFSGWRDAKLQSRCGMGPCQGRVCGAALKILMGWEMESVRPPLFPARVESLLSSTKTQ